MKRLLILLIPIALLAGNSSDLRRRATSGDLKSDIRHEVVYRQLMGKVRILLSAWNQECESRGQVLQSFQDGHMGCGVTAPITPPVAPITQEKK